MKPIKFIGLVANIVFAVLLLLSYKSPTTNPEEDFFISLLGLGYPVLLIVNFLFIFLWGLIDFKWVFISFLSILIGGSTIFTFFNISGHDVQKTDIKVLTYNIKRPYTSDDNANLISFLQSQKADVIALEECGPHFSSQIEEHFNVIGEKFVRLITKHKVLDQGRMVLGSSYNICLWVDLEIEEQKVRVYALHMPSNSITLRTKKLIKNFDLNEKQTYSDSKKILSNVRHGSKERIEALKKILAHAKKSPYPTIMMGDFNDTPTSYIYNQVKENGYFDSFVQRGVGVGTTFRGDIPLLRIDYIFYNNQVECTSFKVGKQKYSDHYPIFGTYSIK